MSVNGNQSERASCLCGDVVIVAKGTPINSRFCHCRLCQKAMGSPSFARALFDQTNLKVTGPVRAFPSSDKLERVFCEKCGTSVGAWRKDGSVAGISLALFDNVTAFPPTEHTWVSERICWNNLNDELIQFSEGA